MLLDYLQRLGCSEKEQKIYKALAAIGLQPASLLARKVGFDRVVTYKHLKKLEEKGLVKVAIRDGIQYFGITGTDGIDAYLSERDEQTEDLRSQVPLIDKELKQITHGEGFVPTVEVFQGKSGIKGLFRDLMYEAKKEHVLRLRLLTSNTFDQQLGQVKLPSFFDDFFRDLQKNNLTIEILEASGTLIPEYIRTININHFSMSALPATRGATHVFLIGSALYLVCYGDTPIGLKVKQEQMSQVFHFLFDTIQKVK
jgi:hypothetical protein